MKEKFLHGAFGIWPKVEWKNYCLIPVGLSDELNNSRVKVYWALWKQIYKPLDKKICLDGAYFGTGFPFALLLDSKDLQQPEKGPIGYVPKLHGFKIFGMNGSKYKIQYDENGEPSNKDTIDRILNTKKTDYTNYNKLHA